MHVSPLAGLKNYVLRVPALSLLRGSFGEADKASHGAGRRRHLPGSLMKIFSDEIFMLCP